jgi:hypothetical protein
MQLGALVEGQLVHENEAAPRANVHAIARTPEEALAQGAR